MLWWMWIIEAFLFLVTFGVLTVFVAYQLSKRDLFFTRLETGNIKFIDHGNSFKKMHCDVPGFILDDMDRLIPDPNKGKNRKVPFMGLYSVGIPPIASVHEGEITKEKENPSGKGIGSWITKTGKEKIRSLRAFFPHPFEFPEVELGSKSPASVNMLAVGKFRVVTPKKLVYELKYDVTGNAFGIIASAVADELKQLDLNQFFDVPMGEDSKLCKKIIGRVNPALVEQVGLELVGLSMRYDPGNEEFRKAMEAKAIAYEMGEARKVTADADLYAAKKDAKAKQAQDEAVVKALGGKHELATEVLTARARPNVTTEVKGGTVVLPVGGGGK